MRTRYAAALIALTWGLMAAPAAAQERPGVLGTCAECHAGVTDNYFEATGHAEEVSCLSCHHIGFSNDAQVTEARRVEACISCHEETESAHIAASHTGAEGETPSCTSCHSIHADATPREAGEAISTRCASCHVGDDHTLHAGVIDDSPVCTDCHVSHSGQSFDPEQPSLAGSCASCHEDTHASHAEADEDFTCTTCHTAGGPQASPSDLELTNQCGACHEDLHPSHAQVDSEGSPSCLQCHDFGQDAPMESAGPATSARCAGCHEDTMDHYLSGGHAAGLGDEPNGDLPNCISCHASHMDPGSERSQLRLAATVRCMECHSQELLVDQYGLPMVASSYEDDFHGATARFMWSHPEAGEELPPIMVCSDCHGAHEVGWSEEVVVADVCRECHEESDDYLAGAWLGHGEIGPRNQPIIFLVQLFYMFLIPFMLVGLFVTIMFHLMTERRHGARVMRTEGMKRLISRLKREPQPKEEMVTRFSLTDRWDHVGAGLTFILLVVTGLPQTRPDMPAARALIELMGGIGMTRIVHRVVGVIFVVLMVMHVARAVMRAIKRSRLPIMTPTRKDFEDLIQTFRHYVLGEKPPKVGKFDYAEKFEYWGMFLGGFVMASTGIILLFPELVTQFLPGVIVAATRVMHGLEATFAVSVVILWHSWGVMLRPEIFPLDTTIFSGKMRVSRLKHEHPLEYERLFPERVEDEPEEDTSEAPGTLLSAPEEGLAGT